MTDTPDLAALLDLLLEALEACPSRLEVTGPGGGPILLEQIAMVAVAKLEAERAAAAGTGLAAIDDTPDAPRLTQHKPK